MIPDEYYFLVKIQVKISKMTEEKTFKTVLRNNVLFVLAWVMWMAC